MRAGFRNYVHSFLVKLRPKPCASLQLYQVYRHFCDIFIDMNTKRKRKLFITKTCLYNLAPLNTTFPASILYKSIAGRYQPVRVADGPITVRYRFIKNAYWVYVVKLGYTFFSYFCSKKYIVGTH